MNKARLAAFLMAAAAAVTLSACGPKQVRTPEPPPDPKTATLVMLLPDAEVLLPFVQGYIGRALVSVAYPAAALLR